MNLYDYILVNNICKTYANTRNHIFSVGIKTCQATRDTHKTVSMKILDSMNKNKNKNKSTLYVKKSF